MNTGVAFQRTETAVCSCETGQFLSTSEALTIRSPRGHFTCHIRVEYRTMSRKREELVNIETSNPMKKLVPSIEDRSRVSFPLVSCITE